MKLSPKSKDKLDTTHLIHDLKSRSIKGTFLFAGARVFNTLIQIGSTAILARLISPENFGLVAMVLVGLELLMNFRDAGLPTATIQRKTIDQSQVSALFWLNVLLGFSLAIIMYFLAPVFSWFYNEPKLINITYVLSLILIFEGLSVQHRALLQRQMHFRVLVFIQVFSQTAGKVIAIVMASMSFGYWALVALPVSTSGIRFILTWIFSDWAPSRPRKTQNIRDMITFGLNLTGTNFINFLHGELDNILIGRICGPFALGLYSKSRNLVSLPNKFITWPADDVLIPSLSILQDNPERYRLFLKRALEKLNFFSQPITTFMIIASHEIILTLLGVQWKGAIPIFTTLGFWAFFSIIQTGTYVILISSNKTRRLLNWQLIKASVIICSIVIGIHWGVLGVAVALAISSFVLIFPEILYCYKGTPFSIPDFWASVWRSLVASISAGMILYFLKIKIILDIENVFLRLCLLAFLFGVLYIGCFLTLPNGPKKLKDIISKIMGLIKKD